METQPVARLGVYFLVVFLLSFTAHSQENYSFFKLLIKNQKDEILLVKWGDEWELPGAKFNEPKSIKVFLEDLASTTGVEVIDHQLFGIYTQRWKGANYLTLMQYYKATYVSGKLTIPSDCTDVGWFSLEESLDKIPYDNMKFMIQWEDEKPSKIASAAFERYKDQNNATQYETVEDWHAVN